jgi:prevent-host-death family protein
VQGVISVDKQCSIAQARDHLPGLVRDVERGSTVELTRRGKPVAVLLSVRDYRRLSGSSTSFWEAFDEFRRSTNLEGLGIERSAFEGLRDPSPGREIEW